MDVFVHTIEHTLEDTWMMFPFLLITYMILEVFERRNNNSDEKIFFGLQKYGPLVGAIVGLLHNAASAFWQPCYLCKEISH